jgi:hypothetical protein
MDTETPPPSSAAPISWSNPLPMFLTNHGLLLQEVRAEGRSWILLRNASPRSTPPPPGVEGTVFDVPDSAGIQVRFDRFPSFAEQMTRLSTVVCGITPKPNFETLATQYRYVESANNPCQRNITLGHLFSALAAEGDKTDSPLLRALDRLVKEHQPDADWAQWGSGAPSRAGRGLEATAKIELIEQFRALCALDRAGLDQLVERHRTPFMLDVPAEAEGSVDHAHVVASLLLHWIQTAMPHLNSHATVGSPDTTVCAYRTLDSRGNPAVLTIQRVGAGDDGAPRARAPGPEEELATHLRDLQQRPGHTHALLLPDDAEPVLRKGLRLAGLDATSVEGFFKFLDRRSTRTGTAEPTKNRDQRRREKKSARGR